MIKIKNPEFEISAVSPKQYPSNNLPEIVLVGKSNVGKSCFINSGFMLRSMVICRRCGEVTIIINVAPGTSMNSESPF